MNMSNNSIKRSEEDNNISGFRMPIEVINGEEYFTELRCLFDKYCGVLSDKAAFCKVEGLCQNVRNTCDCILKILDLLVVGDDILAEKLLVELLSDFLEDQFIVNELNKNYAFRGHVSSSVSREVFDKVNNTELSFFRVRQKGKAEISNKCHMVHLPFDSRALAKSTRFGKEGEPCLYLGTTFWVCCKECDLNLSEDDIYATAFIPNEKGKKLKILNLAVSEALINGVGSSTGSEKEAGKRMQISLLKMFPLVMATSFRITNGEKREDYLISHLLMNVARNMGIDGIAYLSMRGDSGFQYPHGVNLVLPAFDISKNNLYSKYCYTFDMTEPIRFEHQKEDEKKSFINKVYLKYDENDIEMFMSKIEDKEEDIFYGDTEYAAFENYLLSQKISEFSVTADN